MKKIFLSYTSNDPNITEQQLKKIRDRLSKFEVYIDLLDNVSLNWQKEIFDKICECDFVVVLEPSNVETSKWVKNEIELAKVANKSIVYIPSEKWISADDDELKKYFSENNYETREQKRKIS